jgi:methyltransferase-like protein/ubiquinone/menaquinone biosynthesis C-methylase UbiE
MSLSTQEAYEQLPYPSYSHPRTHPDRLFSVAKFLGLNPAPIQNCRVLELGCGDGIGLTSFAYDLKEAQFIGIDLSEAHIVQGNKLINSLNMKNIRLEQKDVMTIDESFGEFDYIIAHGLYSWVPDFVRDKVMEIASKNLAQNGIAYISYNVYPGYRLRQILREMTLHHISQIAEPSKRISQGAAFLKFIADSAKPDTVFSEIMQSELQDISEKRPEDLLYDTLSDFNQPLFFHEFMEHADGHGLQYVSEVYYSDTQRTAFPANAHALLSQMNDIIEREQYIDFICGKRFRQTLLCHKGIKINRQPSHEQMQDYLFESLANPESENPDIKTNRSEKFFGVEEQEVVTDNPFAKAALVILRDALPVYLSPDELLSRIEIAIGITASKEDLCKMLFEFYRVGLVEIHTHQPKFATHLSDKPMASYLVRNQIKFSHGVTALNHLNVYLSDAISKHLITLLDGTRDRETLQKELSEWIEQNNEIENKEMLFSHLPNLLEHTLQKFVKLALIET